MTAVEAFAGAAAVVKPQSAFFERHGSKGIAVLEQVIAACREEGALVLLDVKRGDIGSTVQAYADAYLDPVSPLAVDAVTASPFLGIGSLDPLIDTALANDAGVFVLALTSNPEGAAGAARRHPRRSHGRGRGPRRRRDPQRRRRRARLHRRGGRRHRRTRPPTSAPRTSTSTARCWCPASAPRAAPSTTYAASSAPPPATCSPAAPARSSPPAPTASPSSTPSRHKQRPSQDSAEP